MAERDEEKQRARRYVTKMITWASECISKGKSSFLCPQKMYN